MIPAKQVGGDFYDFFLIDPDRLGFVIGDVSGKGVPAAIYMALSRAMLRATALRGLAPGDCLETVNSVLCLESDSGMFVTTCYCILHLRSGLIEYCTGGHQPPYVQRASEAAVEVLEGTGDMVVGMMGKMPYHTKKTTLKPGDSLILYTDGVTEAMNREEEFFSDERLAGLLQDVPGVSPRQIIEGVIGGVRAFSNGFAQNDDITVLALRYLGV
jgi:sigma-B regulation protein RsbU (phosphoserine phosphatase)